MPTAILVDAGFFLKRYKHLYPSKNHQNAEKVATDLHRMALQHLSQGIGAKKVKKELYRIFVYDCPPIQNKAHNPITKKSIDFSKTDVAKFRLDFHEELKKKRLVALRLGHLSKSGSWNIHENKLKDLLKKKAEISDLEENDVYYEMRQKGVDMKLGVDVASLAYKRLVRQIILISGDADFVPAAKLARREGIDFILDPMRQQIDLSLMEHIDGLRTTVPAKK